MKVNICMIAKDRPRLTAQALQSLHDNTPRNLYTLTVVDDASEIPIGGPLFGLPGWTVVRVDQSKGIVGHARNLSIEMSTHLWERGDFLYLSDNDVYFQPGWLEKMVEAMQKFEMSGPRWARVLGGVRHPFHGVNRTFLMPNGSAVEMTDAVAGYSHLMRWETLDKYGPFDAHAKGVCQSEDFAFCQKIIKDGGLVGYIDPPVLVNCGLTNSEGKPAVGSEAFPRVEGLVQE